MNERAAHFMLEAASQPLDRRWEHPSTRPRNTLKGWSWDFMTAFAIVGVLAVITVGVA